MTHAISPRPLTAAHPPLYRGALRGFAALLLTTLLTACASSPEPRFYTLSATAAPTTATIAQPPAYRLAVGPISIPESIDRAQLLTHTETNRVELYDERRWTESLKTEIPRVIAQDLAARLPDAQVSAYPQHAASNDPDLTVRIDLQRFEGTLGSHVTVEALWSLSNRTPSAATVYGNSRIRETVSNESTAGQRGDRFDALISAYNRALAALSEDIAQAVRKTRESR